VGQVLLAVGLGACLYPTIATWWGERSRRRQWGIVSDGAQTVALGPYRDGRIVRAREARAPAVVVLAAWTAYFLGQMVVPGAIGALGFLAMIPFLHGPDSLTFVCLGLGAPSGIALAARLVGLGGQLLGREDGVTIKARGVATWAIVHNVVLSAALLGGWLFAANTEIVILVAPFWIYGLLSIGHALLLGVAARAIDRHVELELAAG